MKYFGVVLGFILLALFQIAFWGQFPINDAEVNLVLILVIFFSTFNTFLKKYGVFAALSGGLVLDIFSTLPFGVITLSLILISFSCPKISNFFKKINLPAIIILVGLQILIYNILLVSFCKIQNLIPIFEYYQIQYSSLKDFLGWEIIYSLGITILIYFILKKCLKRKLIR